MSAIRVARGHTGRPQGREVRRQLPRPRRPAARRGRQRARRPRPARARPASPTPRCPTPSSRPTTRCPSSTTTPRASSSSRSPPTWAWSPPDDGLPQGPARRVRPRRRAARVRRGDHRVPGRPTAAPRSAPASRPTSPRFGKVIGGGLNIGAYGGRRDVMQQVAPLGPVYQAGTLSGNPLATAAGLAALDLLDAAAYATLAATAERLADGPARRASTRPGIDAVVPQVDSLVGLFFGAEAPVDYAERPAHRHRALRRLLPRHARPRRRPGARAPTR